MSNFLQITFSDIDYIRQVHAAASYLTHVGSTKITKDGFVAIMVAQDIKLRALKGAYTVLEGLEKKVKHFSDCLQLLEWEDRPTPSNFDVQVLINLRTKEINLQTWGAA